MNHTGVASTGSRRQARTNRESGADISNYRSICLTLSLPESHRAGPDPMKGWARGSVATTEGKIGRSERFQWM